MKNKSIGYLLTSLLTAVFAALLFNTAYGFNSPASTPPNGNPGPIPVADGGTNATTTAQALADLGAAASGANTDITSLSPSNGSALQIGSAGLVVGGGTGKITVGTIDPIFRIDGKQYATYAPDMTGVKEETTGVLNLSCKNGVCSNAIDFSNLPNGSNLWIFRRASNFGTNWEGLTVNLTPGFDGRVWYEKNYMQDKLVVLGSSSGEVSYSLSAPRFDASLWPNQPKGLTPGEGLFIPN
jgi:hypothetical protein